MVPTYEAAWGKRPDVWPVLGAPHAEGENWDLHLDPRFLSAEQERHAEAMGDFCLGMHDRYHRPPAQRSQRWTGSRGARYLTFHWYPDRPGKIVLRPLVCTRPTVAPEPLPVAWDGLHERFGNPTQAVWTKDGRPLCPHQKVDLSAWPADAAGIVTCPLHRLRVCVGRREPQAVRSPAAGVRLRDGRARWWVYYNTNVAADLEAEASADLAQLRAEVAAGPTEDRLALALWHGLKSHQSASLGDALSLAARRPAEVARAVARALSRC